MLFIVLSGYDEYINSIQLYVRIFLFSITCMLSCVFMRAEPHHDHEYLVATKYLVLYLL